ncbi:MAG: hypothetical protein ACK49N_03500 [Verrucomicrobiota bacterium]
MEKIELDDTDYRQRQSREEIEYAREYEKWIQSLPPEERRELASLGLDKPSAPGWSSGPALGLDAAELAVAEEVAAPVENEEIHDWRVAADLRVSEAIAKLISELLSNDATLATECLALISGVCYTGASENSIAKKYGMTRAAVSKRCIELCERVGVKNFRAMKSEQAREIYAARAVEVHRQAGRELTTEPPRGRRIETIGGLASRIAGIWRRIQKSQWIKDATAAELLLARRSLRPAFQVADELERLIREKDDRAIITELDRDLSL